MDTQKLWNKNFTIMSIGQFISLFGNSLQRFALSLLILDLTGSAAVFSAIIALTFVPQILLAPFGGAIADRISKKNIMVCLDTFSGLLLLGFTLFFLEGASASTVAIASLMCIMAVIQSIYDPCVRAAIPAVTSYENLAKANSVVSVVSSLTGLLGPIAAGFLYGIYGIRLVFFINIVSFLFSAIMELFLQIPHVKQTLTGSIAKTFLLDIKQTFVYLMKEKPIISQILMISCSFNLFLSPIYSVGVPFMEKIIFGVSDQLYGISEGCVGAGMILGAVLTSVVAKKLPFPKIYCYFNMLTALVLGMGFCALPIILGVGEVSYLSYILFTCIGFCFSFVLAIINILCMTYMQMEIPMEFMGKSMAMVTALSMALMPIGQIVFGMLYDLFAAKTWIIYILVAICCIISTIVTYRLMKKALRDGTLAAS